MRELADGGAYIACDPQTIVGCVFYHVRPDHLYLDRLAVLPGHRGQGIGRALIRTVEERTRQYGLGEVRLSVRLALENQRAYSDALWGIWERDFPQEVGLIPGAKAFIEAAEQLGVTVVYLSNRDEKLRNSTIAALRQNGLSLEGIDNRLLLESTTSDKTERRKIAEGRFNALIYLGDNLRDFSEEFKAPQLASSDEAGQKKAIAERADRVRRANYRWGNDWFILPNPVYGEWQRLCGDNPRGKLKVTAMKQIGQFNAIH